MAKGRQPAAASSNALIYDSSAHGSGPSACRPVYSRTDASIRRVADHVFFYGTLMTPFNRPGRQRITPKLTYGPRHHRAALFDLGIYPAAVPADDNSLVWGEVYEMRDPARCWRCSTRSKGYRRTSPIAASTRACSPT